jgi:hypothetical protein
MAVFFDISPCSMVEFGERIRGSYWLHCNRPHDGGSKHLWNVCKLLPDYTARQPRRKLFLNQSGSNKNTGVDWRITIIVKQWGVREWVGFSWLRIGTSCELCGHAYDYSGFIKRRRVSQPAELHKLTLPLGYLIRPWRRDDVSRNTRLLRNTSSII